MTSHASHRNGGLLISRNELSMPKWVTEQSDRIGPRPPPPPLTQKNDQDSPKQLHSSPKTKQPEPDYEVIEFSNQQYSNAPLRPNSASSGSKTPDNKLKCTLCGSNNPWVTCEECAQQIFCASCDDMFHKHPKRKNHQRKAIEKSRPPLPPKCLPGQSDQAPPVAPPRRNKRGLMTPIMQRKDQGNTKEGPFPEPISPTPSMKNVSSWHERLGSMPKGLNFLNRPLPDTPKTASESSRSTTPKSVFDNIQRPPSVALEKIKTKANATLDRMQFLQQRYRQQKQQMEIERSGSVTDQNISAFDQWSSISQSPSHFRSGSMSSGINSSHLDLMDDNNFNLFNQRHMAFNQHQIVGQRANQIGQRGMSSSVFNLNQINRKQPVANNGWMNNPVQQAQSMAQLNCGNCSQNQSHWNGINQHHMHKAEDTWGNLLPSQQHFNHSNMSLNIPAGYMMQPQMSNLYPPPTFMNQRNLMPQIYPQSYMGGMPVMNPGIICMPPSTSRAASRAGSRMASPAMSRHSITLRRKQRSSYINDEPTDDEDSDEDDRRSIASTRSGVSRSRQRRMSSASQFQLEDDIRSTQTKMSRNRVRNPRRNSVVKYVYNDWPSINNNRSADSGFNSPLKPSRIYSDLDSEGSGTKALVQAKIEQKLKEESLKQKESKSKKQNKSSPSQKTSAAVQTPAVKQTAKQKKLDEAVDEPEKEVKKSLQAEQSNNKKNPLEIIEIRSSATKAEDIKESGRQQTREAEFQQESDYTEEKENIEDDLGPPPSTPDHEWECEFCTFVNEANIKICSICCKTPSIKAKKSISSVLSTEQKPVSLNKKENEHKKQKDTSSVKSGNATMKQARSTSSHNQNTLTKNTNNNQHSDNFLTSKSEFIQNRNDRNESAITNTIQKKESIEDIWTSLDENIQTTANEVARKAHSKESSILSAAFDSSLKSENIEPINIDSRQFQAREMATSPPPQNIYTQTYDILPIHKTETRDESIVKSTTESSQNDLLQRSHLPLCPKKQDLKAFEAEVLNKIHNITHVPSHFHNDHVNQFICSHNDRQQFCSNNDLRMDDIMPEDFEVFNGLGKRQPSISELILLQKTSSQIHSPYEGSTHDLSNREISFVRPSDIDNHKESDLYKYTTEELNAAIKYCGPDMHPLIWLRDNWPKLIQTVQGLATKYGQERSENTIGTISQMEARDALRMHVGNIWQAVSECIEQRQKKYREISLKGNFSREDIVTALTTHKGNVELALLDLGRTQLKPFLMRIWGSPGGIENESGSQSLLIESDPSKTQFNTDKAIHSFLSVNASNCMQKPNDTGAYFINNQMPSPFDRPATFKSQYEKTNQITKNSSNYRTDSNKNPNSSPQLDDFVFANKNVLKDLEALIGNMEHNHQKQNDHLLQSMPNVIANVSPNTENDYDSDSMRILTKSPVIISKYKATSKEDNFENETDIKKFIWQHIQEIVPNLVQQVERELVEDVEDTKNASDKAEETIETIPELEQNVTAPPPPPIDQDEFLMEEVIKPNIKMASIREELPQQYVYTADIATFQLSFDKGLEKEHEEEFEFEKLENALHQVYKMFKYPGNLHTLDQITQDVTKIETTASCSTPNDNLLNAITTLELKTTTESIITQPKSDQTQILPKKIEKIPNDNQTIKTSYEDSYKVNTALLDDNYFQEINNTDNDTASLSKNNMILSRKLEIPNSSKEGTVEVDFDALMKIKCNEDSNTKINNRDHNEVTIMKDLAIPVKEMKQIPEEEAVNSNFLKESAQPSSYTFDLSSPLENDQKINSQQIHPSENHIRLSTVSNDDIHENSNSNEEHKDEKDFIIELKLLRIESSTSTGNKKISKIPIRTGSTKNCTKILTKNDSTEHIKSNELNSVEPTVETEMAQSISNISSAILQSTNNEIKDKIYSMEDNASSDDFQSPETVNEVLLVLQQEDSENTYTIVPSASNSTLHSTISQSSSLKSSQFMLSSDPSKQNLTELVEDTQRLIKQMKDEISIDDFESTTDDGDYSDEFSDEYDDGEEEEWEDEEDEDYEYDDITENITEENDVINYEENSLSKTESPLPSQESQDHREIHNNSVLSNITELSSQSLTPSYDHFEQKKQETNKTDLQYLETESSISEIPNEKVLSPTIIQDDKLFPTQKHSNTLKNSNEKTELVSSLRVLILASNEISESPVEVNSIPEENLQTLNLTKNSEEHTTVYKNNLILENPIFNGSDKDIKTSDDLLLINIQEKTNFVTPSTLTEEPIIQQPELNQESDATNTQNTKINQNSLPSISLATEISSVSVEKQHEERNQNHTEDLTGNDDNVPSTSKPIEALQKKMKTNEEAKVPVKKSATTSKIPKPKEIAKETKQKEVLGLKQKNDIKNKLNTRSKSFSGPPTLTGIASVKTISQKFIGPSSKPQLIASKKYSTATKKPSIVETINKFSKSSMSSEKPATNSIFKPRMHPRIPKKNYHETCFSDDDYESSLDEQEIETLEVRQRKLSVPVFKAYPSVQEPEEVNTEELVHKFMKEELSATVAEAQIAAALVAMKFQQDVSLWAAKECSDLDHAIALLKRECELCNGTYPLNQIVSMLKCTHKCCKQCAKTYFTVQITERSINDCSCPFCKLPELHHQGEHEDENLEYFSNLDILLKNILEPEVHELFQCKLRDRTLLKDPNFKWCVHCSSGFFARPKQKRLICPDCGSVTCAQCRKTWQKQHEGISCEQFSEWESANDPEIQAMGVQQHLERNGIDCPKCKFKYSLARGGCMHFTCTQCKYEFCYGCAKPFMMGAKCTISSYCAKLGLHAHHPRNCLFYLRDKLPIQLQILLKNNNVSYEVDPFEVPNTEDDNQPSSSKKKELLCSIPIQKETPTGMVDTKCNGDVPEKHAGMCRNHYVEYLTAKVAKAKIDPLPIFDLTDCVQELRRRGISLPERGPWDTDEIYKNMCAEVIQKNIPLLTD